jgi:hypothetical protein
MNQFRRWYLTNQKEITWFLIGFLTLAGVQELARGEYLSAVISFALVVINYTFLNK